MMNFFFNLKKNNALYILNTCKKHPATNVVSNNTEYAKTISKVNIITCLLFFTLFISTHAYNQELSIDVVRNKMLILNDINIPSDFDFHSKSKETFAAHNLTSFELLKMFTIESEKTDSVTAFIVKELLTHYKKELKQVFAYKTFLTKTFSQKYPKNTIDDDFFLLPAVLSGFNIKHSSNLGVGLWRLNYINTIKYNVLRIDECIDERMDWYKSTLLALAYYEELKKLFDDTDKVVCAFLSSPIIMRNYVDIDSLPFNISSEFFFFKALKLIDSHKKELNLYTQSISKNKSIDTLIFKHRLHLTPLAIYLDIDKSNLLNYNPSYRKDFVLENKNDNFLFLPKKWTSQMDTNTLKMLQQADSTFFSNNPFIDKPKATISYTDTIIHVVKRGETLSVIANKYPKVSMNDIVKINNLNSPDKIKEGQKLLIPKF